MDQGWVRYTNFSKDVSGSDWMSGLDWMDISSSGRMDQFGSDISS